MTRTLFTGWTSLLERQVAQTSATCRRHALLVAAALHLGPATGYTDAVLLLHGPDLPGTSTTAGLPAAQQRHLVEVLGFPTAARALWRLPTIDRAAAAELTSRPAETAADALGLLRLASRGHATGCADDAMVYAGRYLTAHTGVSDEQLDTDDATYRSLTTAVRAVLGSPRSPDVLRGQAVQTLHIAQQGTRAVLTPGLQPAGGTPLQVREVRAACVSGNDPTHTVAAIGAADTGDELTSYLPAVTDVARAVAWLDNAAAASAPDHARRAVRGLLDTAAGGWQLPLDQVDNGHVYAAIVALTDVVADDPQRSRLAATLIGDWDAPLAGLISAVRSLTGRS